MAIMWKLILVVIYLFKRFVCKVNGEFKAKVYIPEGSTPDRENVHCPPTVEDMRTIFPNWGKDPSKRSINLQKRADPDNPFPNCAPDEMTEVLIELEVKGEGTLVTVSTDPITRDMTGEAKIGVSTLDRELSDESLLDSQIAIVDTTKDKTKNGDYYLVLDKDYSNREGVHKYFSQLIDIPLSAGKYTVVISKEGAYDQGYTIVTGSCKPDSQCTWVEK